MATGTDPNSNWRRDTSCPVPACMTRISDHLNFSEIRPSLGNSYAKLHLNEIIPKHLRRINSIILGYFGCISASPSTHIFPIWVILTLLGPQEVEKKTTISKSYAATTLVSTWERHWSEMRSAAEKGATGHATYNPYHPWDWHIYRSVNGWFWWSVNVGKYTIHGSYG